MKFKKLISLVLAAGMAFSLCACAPTEITKKDAYDDFTYPAKKYAIISRSLNDAVVKGYWVDEVQFAYHYYPNGLDANAKNDTAFAWPYTETVAASWRLATLGEQSKTDITTYYKSGLYGFEYYRTMRSDYLSYSAGRAHEVGKAGGDTYYDDNVWISREFLNAYEILKDEAYLTKSVGVAEYVYSGWADDDLGGIYWCEQKKTSRNTCSNAPAALLFARLYETTKDTKWLDRAKQVYAWTYKTLLDPSDNVYWDNISNEGHITNWKFTYNTGSMIGAAVKLYEITKQEAYLNQAKASAAGAFNHWFKQKQGKDYRVIDSANPWFNVLLLDAYTELYPYDKEQTLTYIQTYEANLNYAYSLRDVASGFMPSDWANGFSKDENNKDKVYGLNVLDMAANAENFGTLAHFYEYVKGE